MNNIFKGSCARALATIISFIVSSCASVDQFSSRVPDGNINNQFAINDELLLNILRASKYQSLSWNPVNQISGGQTETLSTGLPAINIGPHQTAAQGIYSITNSVSSGVTGSYQSAPLLTTAFQTGMLTPVGLKTLASLGSYYSREVLFYALIAAIDIKAVSTNESTRLINDPGQDYVDITNSSAFNPSKCKSIATGNDNKAHLFPGSSCSYSKFVALMSTLVEAGLSTELVQYATNATPQNSATGAPLSQTTTVQQGRLCFSDILRAIAVRAEGAPICGQITRTQRLGGSIVQIRTETHKADDATIGTDTRSASRTTTTTENAALPIRDGGPFKVSYPGVGVIEISFELRSPDGFLSYLGSWYNYGDKVLFPGYDVVPAKRILAGDGMYLSIEKGFGSDCYASIRYEGNDFCVPFKATHTTMLMDIAVILRNLNVQPADLNAPVTVRLAN